MRLKFVISMLLVATVVASSLAQHPVYVEAFHKSRTTGPQPVIVILVRFLDTPSVKSREDIQALVFTNLNAYLREASYGQAWLQGDVTPWYDLSKPVTEYNSQRGMKELIRDSIRLADPDYDLTKYALVMIVHSGDDAYRSRNSRDMRSFATSDPTDIRTSGGGMRAPVAVLAELDPMGPFAHELLYAWGIPVLWQRTSNGAQDLVGEWCVMGHGYWGGNGTMPSHPCGWTKIKLGWINGTRINEVAIGETATIRLDRLETPSSGIQLIKLPVTDKVYYLVELRSRIGFDRSLPGDGVLVSFVDENKGDGEGPVKIMSSNPDDPNLNYASYTKDDFFQDATSSVAVFVTSTGSSSMVKIDRTQLPQFSKVIIQTPFKGVQVKADGKGLTADSAGKVKLALSQGKHWIEVQEYMTAGKGFRYLFKSWGDGVTGTSRTLVVNSSSTFTLDYRRQYYISVSSPVGQAKGSGWYDDGSRATFSVSPYQDLGNRTRMHFNAWIGDVDARTAEASILVDGPKNIFAYWKREYLLSISTDGLPGGTPVDILVNGATKTVTDAAQEWIEEGSYLSFQLAQEKLSTSSGSFVFKEWENSTRGPASADFAVNSPKALIAAFRQEAGGPQTLSPFAKNPKISRVGEMKDVWVNSIDYFVARENSTAARIGLRPLAQIAQWASLTYDILSPIPWLSALATPMVAGFLIGAVYLLPILLLAFAIARLAGARRFGTRILLPLAVVWLLAVIPILLIPFVPTAFSEAFTIISLVTVLATTVILTALGIALKVVNSFSR